MMIKTEVVLREKKEIVEKTCSFCGFKVTEFFGTIGNMDIYFGYGSLYDDNRYSFQICDDCFDKMIVKKTKEKSFEKNVWMNE